MDEFQLDEVYEYIVDNSRGKMQLTFDSPANLRYWLEKCEPYEYKKDGGYITIETIVEQLSRKYGQYDKTHDDINVDYYVKNGNCVELRSPGLRKISPKPIAMKPNLRVLATKKRATNKEDEEEKNYVCAVCFDRFRTNSGLITHSRKHSPKGSFQCPYCSREPYQTKSNLTKHLHKVHPESGLLSKSSPTPAYKQPVHKIVKRNRSKQDENIYGEHQSSLAPYLQPQLHKVR